MKRMISLLLSITMIVFMLNMYVFANEPEVKEYSIGSYYQLGTYNNEPILWQCVDADENGVLMLSDKILCYKKYDRDTPGVKDRHSYYGRNAEGGNYLWEESALRDWLNSSTDYLNTTWHRSIPEGVEFNPYNSEAGFLSDNNFTESERSVMKTVNQWQVLHLWDALQNENGVKWAFGYDYSPEGKLDHLSYVCMAKEHYEPKNKFKFSEDGCFSHVEGAMYRATDTVFLLNTKQVYNMVQNIGYKIAQPTLQAKTELYNNINKNIEVDSDDVEKEYLYWWFIGPGYGNFNGQFTIYYFDSGEFVPAKKYATRIDIGVRPAFYLNEANAVIKSGSGTETDPYVLDGKAQEYTTVYVNNEQMQFDEQPVYENDRLLVPVRAIFEELGAEVEWDAEDEIITAKDDEHNVVMQIGNPDMGNGTEIITLDVPPRLIGDRTMVPLRAVAKSLGARVRYIEDLDRVSIDKPTLPMDFGPGVGHENWQQDSELRQRMEADNWYPDYIMLDYPRYWAENDID